MKYDFEGWATRAGVECSDGVVISHGAFAGQDGATVPLVWNHDHNTPENVLGRVQLEYEEDGIRAYGAFNNTESAQSAKELIKHGDINALSIYANKLHKNGRQVTDGVIREVSLVLAGANPEALITDVIAHSDGYEEIIVKTDFGDDFVMHANTKSKDEEEEDSDKSKDTKSENKTENKTEKKPSGKNPDENSKDDKSQNGPTVKDVFASMTEDQQNAIEDVAAAWTTVKSKEQITPELQNSLNIIRDMDDQQQQVALYLINEYVKSEGTNEPSEEEDMRHNVFENDANLINGEDYLKQHAAEINKLCKQRGSFKDAMNEFAENHEDELKHAATSGDYIAHAIASGEDGLDAIMPLPTTIPGGAPEQLWDDDAWVTIFMNRVSKSPMAIVRTIQGDLMAGKYRAKGYNRGKNDGKKFKSEDMEFIKRTTHPTTIYVKDEFHRDDAIDVTDFDVINYIEQMMTRALRLEIAQAALIGDGREAGTNDKIDENCIRPILKDEDVYTIKAEMDIEGMKTKLQGTNTGANFGEEFIMTESMIETLTLARINYRGTGKPVMFMEPSILAKMLLTKDMNGRRIYKSAAELASELNVSEIVEVPQMEGLQRKDSNSQMHDVYAIVVNPADYNLGNTAGGKVCKYEDFDIDFNMRKFLHETRLSGALKRVYSAIVIEAPAAPLGRSAKPAGSSSTSSTGSSN